MEGLIRKYIIEAFNRKNQQEIAVELWAHTYDEAVKRATPYIAEQLQCSEEDVFIIPPARETDRI